MPKRNLLWLLAIAGVALTTYFLSRSGSSSTLRRPEPQFDPVTRAYKKIWANCYHPIPQQELRAGAIQGIVDRLDRFSVYVPPETMDRFQNRLNGLAGGLGISLDTDGGNVRIAGVEFGSPAHRKGLTTGQVILAIDESETSSLSAAQVESLLDVPVGRSVELTLRDPDADEADDPETVTLTADSWPMEVVEGLFRDGQGRWVWHIPAPVDEKSNRPRGKIVYIRLREFNELTVQQLTKKRRLISPASPVILDLRDNPGGTLPIGQQVANLFLQAGEIVRVRDADGNTETHKATAAGTWPAGPMVVLVNEHSASAAELVGGALKYNDRAVIVGTRTFGKGCVQTPIQLGDGLGLIYLTTAEFSVGTDESITRWEDAPRWGVDPHLPVIVDADERAGRLRLDRRGRLIVTETQPESEPAVDLPDPTQTRIYQRLVADRCLARAVDLLNRPEEHARILKDAAEAREVRLRQRAEEETENEHE